MDEKKKLARGFVGFLLAMLLMTFVSRTVYVSRMPQIRWIHPTASSVRKEWQTDGTVETVNSRAVTGLDGLLVKRVCVTAGDPIEADTVLYEVDPEDLSEQLSRLEAEEQLWQEQLRSRKQETATETARAQEDYNTSVIELDRRIEACRALLEDALEDLELHLFRIPEEDAEDEIWIAWADERTRIDRVVEARQRDLEEAEFAKEKALTQADRSIADARQAQDAAAGGYGTGMSGIAQVQEREAKIEVWKALQEDEGKVRAGQTGTVLEVMLQAGTRMGSEAVLRYADAESGQIFRTVITQEQKSTLHTGDTVKLRFPNSAEEVMETVDAIAQEGGGYAVTIHLAPGIAQGRTEAAMEVTSTSEVYDFVVPVSALHNDGANCIYVLEEKNGILGTQSSIRSLTVRLLDKNDSYAAVADELLSADLKVVTESDKELSNGMAVKEWGE